MIEGEFHGAGQPSRTNDLHDLIDEKIRVLIVEMHAGGWNTEEVLLAVNDVIRLRWLAKLNDNSVAAPTMQENFVSDGNEG